MNRLKPSYDSAAAGLPVLAHTMEVSTEEEVKTEYVVFCSALARNSKQHCQEVLKTRVVALCAQCLKNGGEMLVEKTLHLLGNLAKHNDSAFEQFKQEGILGLVGEAIERHP